MGRAAAILTASVGSLGSEFGSLPHCSLGLLLAAGGGRKRRQPRLQPPPCHAKVSRASSSAPNGTTPTPQARSISSHRLWFTPNRCATSSRALQLPPPGVQLPPAGRNLDQEAPIPQEVVHLAVGVGGSGGRGPKANPLRDPPHPQAPAGCAHKLAADPRAACRSSDAQAVSVAWSCGSAGNGRIPSDRSAGIAGDLRGYRAHRCWLRLKSWS